MSVITVLLTLFSNFLVAGTMEIVGEAQMLAEKSDLGTDMLEKLLELNFGGLMHSSSRRMTQGVYLPEEGKNMALIENTQIVLLLLIIYSRSSPLVQPESRDQGCSAWHQLRQRCRCEIKSCRGGTG